MKKLLLTFLAAMCCTVMSNAQTSQPENEIWYTTSNGVELIDFNHNAFGGATIVSNKYDEKMGKGCITFNGDVTSIGNDAFFCSLYLTSITLPSGVTSIGTYAFTDCSSLVSINIPSGLTRIETSTFEGCICLASITLPSGVTSIGDYAFSGCSGLTSITIPSGVTSIGDYAFSDCSGLTFIALPNGVTKIENGTFMNCSSLTSITLPSVVTSIGDKAFLDCSNLDSITLPSGLTNIGHGAFQNCSGLTEILLPETINNLGQSPFGNCSSLAYAMFQGTTPPNFPKGSNPFDNCGTEVDGGTILVVPNGDAVNSFKTAGYANVYSATDPTIVDEYKTKVLDEINKAIKGTTLTQGDAAMVSACQTNINNTTNFVTIYQEKNKALSIINLQKTKDAAIADIDTALGSGTILMAQEGIDVLTECRSNIISATNIGMVKAEIQIALAIGRQYAKTTLHSYYVNLPEDILQTYYDQIKNATSLADIDKIVKEAKNAFNDRPHFVVGEKWYLVTKRENYEYNHMADYTSGSIYIQDGVRYESDSQIFLTQGEIEFTRTLPEGVWQCWYEPFEVEVDNEKFDAAEVAGILFNAQGETVVAFNKLENGAEMQANTVYVIRAKEGQGNLKIKAKRIYLKQSEETKLTIQSAYEVFTLTGNYSPKEHGDWYTLDKTGTFCQMANGSLKPQRFYMTITPRKDTYYPKKHAASAQPFIRMTVLGDDDDMTGIEALPESQEGKNVIYNLNGQRVADIQRGEMYIVNGKKYMAK